MTDTLEAPDKLASRGRRPLVLAGAVSAAVLCPLVCELVLGGLSNGAALELSDVVWGGGWAALLGVALAFLVMTRALRPGRGPGWLILLSMGAGVAYPVLFLGPFALSSLGSSDLGEILRIFVLGPVLITIVGMIASVPAGLAFGVLFGTGVLHARWSLDHPAHDQAAQTWVSAAVMLAAASICAFLMALMVAGAYCQALFLAILPALEVVPPEGTDAEWTRLVVLPGPLLLAGAACLLKAWWEQRRIERFARAVLAGTHPRWRVDEASASSEDEAVLPLREKDRTQLPRRFIREREAGQPYRGSARAVAFVAAADR